MTHRERFNGICRFQPVDRAPYWAAGRWSETTRRWISEGMPEDVNYTDYFGCEETKGIPVYYGPWPRFPYEVIEDEGETQVVRNHEGIIMRVYKVDGDRSMPHFLEFPVKTREDYRRLIKPRLCNNPRERFPEDWSTRVESWKERTDPLCLFGDRWSGFFGPLRNIMGLENLCYAFYDDPALVEEMMDDVCDNVLMITEQILNDTDIDYWAFWEDMGMKTGPLLSPALFKKFMVPRYRRVTDYLRSRGVDLIFVDSDGDVHDLIPLWLDGGLTGIWPCEIAANMEPAPIIKEYGRDLLVFGGIDKRALAAGPQAIDEELKKVPPLVAQGGYIPMIDHSCPPDISWPNFCYYMEKVKEAIRIA
jgi:uroporphyrinogen decarboxylase